MALIVEDGSGVAGAESYITLAAASTYHANRGDTSFSGLATDALREAALRKATDYMLQMYRERWKGLRVSASQALDWPRQGVEYDDALMAYVAQTVVPNEVQWACAELALSSIAGALAPDLARGVLSESIGPISVTYDPASPQYTRYRRVDALLSPFLRTSGAMTKVVRT